MGYGVLIWDHHQRRVRKAIRREVSYLSVYHVEWQRPLHHSWWFKKEFEVGSTELFVKYTHETDVLNV